MGALEEGACQTLAETFSVRLAELGGQDSKERMARERKRAQIASLQQKQAQLMSYKESLLASLADVEAKIDAIKAKVNELEPGMVLYV